MQKKKGCWHIIKIFFCKEQKNIRFWQSQNKKGNSYIIKLGIFLFLICTNAWASPPLTLKDAISKGLENNKRVASAKEQLKGAKAGVAGAISSLYPHLNLTSNLNYTEPLGKNEAEEQDNYNASFGLGLAQTIFDDKNKLSIKSAKKDLESEKLEYEILRQAVYIDVAEAYYRLLNAKEREKVYQKGIEKAGYLYKIISAKLEEGRVSEIDAKRGLLNLKEEEGRLKTAQMERLILEENLKNLIGIEASINEEIRFNPISVNLNEAISLALNTNLELKKEKINIEKQILSKRMIKSQYLPKASLSGNYSCAGTDKTLGKSIDELKRKEYQYSISASIEIPIYDGGYITSQIIQKEADINSSRISLEQIWEKIILDVKERAVRLLEAKDRVIRQEENLSIAKEALAIMEARYELGKASLDEVFETQNKVREVQLNYINTLSDYEVYRIKFLIAQGGRYEDF